MENKRISLLLAKEAEEFFNDVDETLKQNFEFKTALSSDDIIKDIYIFDPDFIIFNLSSLSEDNYRSLSKLKNNTIDTKYQILFIRNKEEAINIVNAFQEGVNRYCRKIFSMIEKNAGILNFIELRQNREEMQVIYGELKSAAQELNKKNKQLQNAIENIEKLTVTDYLTGVYNRRYMIDRIYQEIIRYKRKKRIFSFVLCDIDNFKNINDTYGHAFGDQILMDTAKFLNSTCREMDVLARWGGDEFLILLPETDISGAFIFSERARKTFEARLFDYDHKNLKLSLTFGISEYDDKDGMNDSIKKADDALLKGKISGRNIVIPGCEL